MLTLWISNDTVKAVTGKAGASRVDVEQMYYITDQSASIRNGVIQDKEVFGQLIEAFWQQNKLPRKDVMLVVDSPEFATKILELPAMKEKDTFAYLPREFADLDRTKDPLFCYSPMPHGDRKTQRLCATVVERSLVETYVEVFNELGIQLVDVQAAQPSMIRLLQMLPEIKNRTCIVQLVDGKDTTSFLFVEGIYKYSSRGHLGNEHGTPGFGVEVARSISHILQFAKAQQIDQPITDIFLGGLFAGDLEYCEESIYQMDPGLTVATLSGKGTVSVGKQAGFRFSDFVAPISGLLEVKKQASFIAQIKRDTEKEAARDKRLLMVLPVLILAAAAAVLISFLWMQTNTKEQQLAEILEYNSSPDVVDRCYQYDYLSVAVTTLNEKLAAVSQSRAFVDSYPLPNQRVIDVLNRKAAGMVGISITGYNATTGILNCDTSAAEVDIIHQYIETLREEDIFYHVDYTGYSYQDREGFWIVNVRCYLSETAGK